MNLELLRQKNTASLRDSPVSQLPDELELSVDLGDDHQQLAHSSPLCCQFNRRGTLLAIGCNDGRIILWDFLTRQISRIVLVHSSAVIAVSWTKTGHHLLSCSAGDTTVCLTDVLTGKVIKQYTFPTMVTLVQFDPRTSDRFLACLLKHAAVVVDVETGRHDVVPLDPDDSDTQLTGTFSSCGQYLYTGNGRGKICVTDLSNMELLLTFRVAATNTSAIRSIQFPRVGSSFLVNTADRVIRVYDTKDVLSCAEAKTQPIALQKLQDLVNRTLWKKCAFSGDSAFVCAGSTRQHCVYIWDKVLGSLVKILTGPKGEHLLDLTWHPARPVIVSIAGTTISIWGQKQVENWSAFSPNFQELEENVEYVEKEGEFDMMDEDQSDADDDAADELDVDVVTQSPIPAHVDSDEDDSSDPRRDLLIIPVAPDVDNPEEGDWPITTSSTASTTAPTATPTDEEDGPQVFTVDVSTAPSEEGETERSQGATVTRGSTARGGKVVPGKRTAKDPWTNKPTGGKKPKKRDAKWR